MTTAAGIVLCGGKSSRMGASKALLPFGNETMLQRVVRLLETVVSPVVVVAARGQALPELPASILVTRDERDEQGPLEGLRTGLRALPVSVNIAYATSCDVPLLEPRFVERMVQLLDGYDVAAMETDGFAHPLSAVYKRSVLPQIEEQLSKQELRASAALDLMRTRRVKRGEVISVDPQLRSLRNVNTKEDYLAALVEAGLTL